MTDIFWLQRNWKIWIRTLIEGETSQRGASFEKWHIFGYEDAKNCRFLEFQAAKLLKSDIFLKNILQHLKILSFKVQMGNSM